MFLGLQGHVNFTTVLLVDSQPREQQNIIWVSSLVSTLLYLWE